MQIPSGRTSCPGLDNVYCFIMMIRKSKGAKVVLYGTLWKVGIVRSAFLFVCLFGLTLFSLNILRKEKKSRVARSGQIKKGG